MHPRSSDMKELTLKEALVLSPIEKHVLYNRFPTRLFVNIILVILVTLQVSFIFDYSAAYPRQTDRVFRYLFLGSNDDESLTLVMDSPQDVQKQLRQVQEVFMNLDNYMYQDVNVTTTKFQLHAYLKYPIERRETYDIDPTKGFTDPFNVSEIASIKNFLERVLQIEITVRNLTMTNYLDSTVQNLCLNWSVSILYDLHDFSQIATTVSSESVLCSASSVVAGSDSSVGISVIVLCLAFISLIRMISKFLKIGRAFIEIKSAYINFVNHNAVKDMSKIEIQKQELMDAAGENIEDKMEDYFMYQSWEDVPFSAKMSFFSGWFIFNTIGNMFQVVSSLMLLTTYFSPIAAQGFYISEVVLGLSVFCTWIQLLQYLGFWKNLTMMTSTIQKASTPLLVFFSICLPVFLGIAILGYSLFWRYDKFVSVGMSMRSLFALTCGDIVHETFLDTWDEGMKSIAFFIIYMVLYYTAFANIFVAIIMEGYSKAEFRKQIDNDDPIPTADSLKVEKQMSLELPQRSKDIKLIKPELKKNLSNELSNPHLSDNARNTVNLLMYENEEVKEELEDLIKIKSVIQNRNYDKKTKDFLESLLNAQVIKISKKISYYEMMYKRSLETKPSAEGAHLDQ